ncbi:hypothetical protein KCP71_04260 [Salmonella enterica subsp. enterica]|nr:hypothetical protein KCP71_04260 [Salmonella enterica subsp. enterica]
MKALTASNKRCLISSGSHQPYSMPPTRGNAQRFSSVPQNAAEEHLCALARKGCLKLLFGASRGNPSAAMVKKSDGLPLVGRVAAVNCRVAAYGAAITVSILHRSNPAPISAARERNVDERHRYYAWYRWRYIKRRIRNGRGCRSH